MAPQVPARVRRRRAAAAATASRGGSPSKPSTTRARDRLSARGASRPARPSTSFRGWLDARRPAPLPPDRYACGRRPVRSAARARPLVRAVARRRWPPTRGRRSTKRSRGWTSAPERSRRAAGPRCSSAWPTRIRRATTICRRISAIWDACRERARAAISSPGRTRRSATCRSRFTRATPRRSSTTCSTDRRRRSIVCRCTTTSSRRSSRHAGGRAAAAAARHEHERDQAEPRRASRRDRAPRAEPLRLRTAPSAIGRIAAVDCASRIGMFLGGTMAEGWACYATDLMDEVGFLTPEESVAQQHTRVRLLARAVVDIGLHERNADLRRGGRRSIAIGSACRPKPRARKTCKNSMFPGTALMYWLGTEGTAPLRREQRARRRRVVLAPPLSRPLLCVRLDPGAADRADLVMMRIAVARPAGRAWRA